MIIPCSFKGALISNFGTVLYVKTQNDYNKCSHKLLSRFLYKETAINAIMLITLNAGGKNSHQLLNTKSSIAYTWH